VSVEEEGDGVIPSPVPLGRGLVLQRLDLPAQQVEFAGEPKYVKEKNGPDESICKKKIG
jgi:hypothetical protein